jgi:anti-sigma regulatory factor (Ser/Thr protein kinase)
MNVAEFERRGAGRGAELRLSVPPDPRQGLIVRREVLAFAERHNILGEDVIDFVAAIGEALANAIEHARTNEPIEVAMWLLGTDRLFASVTDKGVGFSPNDRPLDSLLPDAYAERGRGLPIMRRCVDIFNVRSAPGQGTHVTLGCFIQRAARDYEQQRTVAG